MTVRVYVLMVVIVFLYFSSVQTCPCIGQHFSKHSLTLLAKDEEGVPEEN